jgi:hypothetical protein
MESYFVRHTERMAVVEKAINYLWEHDKIAIFFPDVSHDAPKEVEDNESLNEDDYRLYDPGCTRALRVFKEMNKNGGYIWAEYRNRRDIKVGKIIPNSFEIYETKWAPNEFPYERTAKLKTLQIDRKSVRIISSSQAMSLRAARPRQGTMMRWPSAGNRLKALVEGIPMEEYWDSLSPDMQETVCSEFLRKPDAAECPVLERLLLPVGRTLKHVDIFGYATDKKMLFAQITYSKKEEAGIKIQDLEAYRDSNTHLVFFCDCEEIHIENSVLFIPWKRVEHWLKNDKTYLRKLLEI